MISWQKSPFTADGKFVPVDWDPGEKTGLSIPDEQTRTKAQRGMRNAAGSTVCQMYGGTVGAYLNSADLSGKGIDAQGNPLPGSRWLQADGDTVLHVRPGGDHPSLARA